MRCRHCRNSSSCIRSKGTLQHFVINWRLSQQSTANPETSDLYGRDSSVFSLYVTGRIFRRSSFVWTNYWETCPMLDVGNESVKCNFPQWVVCLAALCTHNSRGINSHCYASRCQLGNVLTQDHHQWRAECLQRFSSYNNNNDKYIYNAPY